MKFLLYTLFVVISHSGIAISGKDYLAKVQANYERLSTFELNMSYKLYKGHHGTEVLQAYTSYYVKNAAKAYRKIEQTEFVYFNEMTLNIDHDHGVVVVTDKEESEFLDIDLKATLSYCKDIKVLTKGDNYQVTLILKSKTDIPYSKVSFLLDQSFWIKSATFYYTTQTNFGTYQQQDLDFPKLEVTYGDIKKGTKQLESLSLNQFLSIKQGKILLAERYKNYELIDRRTVAQQ